MISDLRLLLSVATQLIDCQDSLVNSTQMTYTVSSGSYVTTLLAYHPSVMSVLLGGGSGIL